MAFYCGLAPGRSAASETHAVAVALLRSPFATAAERRRAVSALDASSLPLTLRQDRPATVRLTLVQERGENIALSGTGPQDRVEPLAQSERNRVIALDCHIARDASQARQIELRRGSRVTRIEIEAPKEPQALRLPDNQESAGLWIILPLKDGGPVLEACLQSVMQNLACFPEARLVLVDDGSEHPRTKALLAGLAHRPGVTVTRTSGSLGFTGAVNHGLCQIGRGPVLLLNSDTWLPAQTLRRMLEHLKDPEIGTVTPLSNNAGSVSLLGPGRPARIPPPQICERLAETAYRVNRGVAIDLPSGNGFAMLISEPCLRAIGPLSGLYDSGYYEEVDFCLRAGLRGWRHVAAVDCFVGHVGSVTYGREKQRLAAVNHRHLLQRFPEYSRRYKAFAALDPVKPAREGLLAAASEYFTAEPVNDMIAHPGRARASLPLPPRGPLILPMRGNLPRGLQDGVSGQLRRHLRLVPQDTLQRCGLTLDPGHDLWGIVDPTTALLRVWSGTEPACLLSMHCGAGVNLADFIDFRTALLDILAERAETRGHYAIPV